MPLLYLVRHGIAEDRSATGRDEDRQLTPDGADKLQRAALGLASLEVRPDAIWSSPLRRARQTAELVRNALAPALERAMEEPRLRPEADVDAMLDALKAASDLQALILVGHEPSISALGAALLTGSPNGARIPFKPGSVLAIELTSFLQPGRGTLRWFLTADQLRGLS